MFKLAQPERILHAVFKASLINLAARIVNYLRYVVIAVYMGFTAETDAFFLAVAMISLFLVVSNALETLGVPQMTEARMRGDERQFRKIVSRLTGVVIFLVFGVFILFGLMQPLLLSIPQGFDELTLGYYQQHLFLLLPYLIAFIFFQFFGGVLRSRRQFTVFFLGELIAALVTLGILFWGLSHAWGSWVLPASMGAGYMVGVIFLFLFVKAHLGMALKWDMESLGLLRRLGALASVAGVYFLLQAVDKGFASLLPTKSVSALTYGLLLANAPFTVIRPQNFYITYLSEGNAHYGVLGKLVIKVMGIGILAAAGLWILMPWIVDFLFNYGSFSQLDHALVVEAGRFYALSLPLLFIWPMFYQTFQIRDRLGWAFVIGIAAVVINALLNYWLMVVNDFGIIGITLGTLGAYVVMVASGFVLLRRMG